MDAGNISLKSPALHRTRTWRKTLLRCGWLMCGLMWICIATTLCGCSSMSGYAMNRSGQSYFKKGNYTAAQHEFQRAMIDRPNHATYAYNLAKTLEKQGDVTAAEQMYHRALNLNPEHQPAYHGLSEMLVAQGRGEESRHLMTAWTATQPYSTKAHLELAQLERQNGNLAGAQQQLAQALQLKPRSPKTLRQMGELQEQMGNAPAAAAYYQRSLAMNPLQPQVSTRLTSMQNRGFQPGAMESGAMLAQNNFEGVPMQAAYGPQDQFPGAPVMASGNSMPQMMPGMQQMMAANGQTNWSDAVEVTPEQFAAMGGQIIGNPMQSPAMAQGGVAASPMSWGMNAPSPMMQQGQVMQQAPAMHQTQMARQAPMQQQSSMMQQPPVMQQAGGQMYAPAQPMPLPTEGMANAEPIPTESSGPSVEAF